MKPGYKLVIMKPFLITMLQILGYFVLFSLIALPFLALWYPYVEGHLPELAETPATQWPVEAVSILAALLAAWLMSFASKSVQDYNFGLRRRTFAQHTLTGLLIGLGMVAFTLTSLSLIGALSGNPQYRFVWSGMLAALITTVSLNAIAQEIIFRGYFINVLKRKFHSFSCGRFHTSLAHIHNLGAKPFPWRYLNGARLLAN